MGSVNNTDTRVKPPGFSFVPVVETIRTRDVSIALIKEYDPWDSPGNEMVLQGLGESYDIFSHVGFSSISFYDYDRKIHWFPTILNMGEFGMIYPEGTKDNWSWKFAQVRELSEEEQKDPIYEGHEHTLDIENAKEYGQYEFLQACQEMGIVKKDL
mgnify:CR=1 FL=1